MRMSDWSSDVCSSDLWGKHPTHVFTYRGNPLRSANTRKWRAALKTYGIEDFRWHDLRHTWASWLRRNDVPTWVLQELGGWKSESTVRRYAHMSVKHLQPYSEIGRAHVWTTVTNAHLVCRLLLATKTDTTPGSNDTTNDLY